MSPFGSTITAESELREIFRPPSRGAVAKEIDHLDDHCRAFIARSPFVLVGTTNTNGTGDVSPKGGPPGFVRVLDDHRLAFGELPGNNRLDCYTNILHTSAVGLLFLLPGVDECLRVNGTGHVVTSPKVLEECGLDGRLPKIALGVEVREAFIHCAKAIRRASLWSPDGWPTTTDMPTIACMLATHAGITEDPDGTATAAALEAGYATTMWNSEPTADNASREA